jgi:rhodanese-related sulfurtransferase
MAKTFHQLVAEAREGIALVSPAEAQQRLQQDPTTLVVDVRDAADVHTTGIIANAINVSVGMLAVRADQELPEQYRNPQLQDRSRPIIVTCTIGAIASFGARTLKEMGFTNVSILDGGTKGWKEAGFPTRQR